MVSAVPIDGYCRTDSINSHLILVNLDLNCCCLAVLRWKVNAFSEFTYAEIGKERFSSSQRITLMFQVLGGSVELVAV